MTEGEWLASNDPERMRQLPAVASRQRKIRLWACACCRRIWHLVNSSLCHQSVEVAEEFADGLVAEHGLVAAHRAAILAVDEAEHRWAGRIEMAGGDLGEGYYPHQGLEEAIAAEEALAVVSSPLVAPLGEVARTAIKAVLFAVDPQPLAFVPGATPTRERARREEEAAQAALLRDIFGNPFQPVSLEPTWLSATVQAMATGIYAERAFDRMPILADALEEAGCDNLDVLNHCRGPGPHVLGCWVVDLLLGKE